MHTIKKLLVGLCGVLLMGSCEKTFSPDTPLPNTLSPSLFVVNNNNRVLSLNPETGEKKWEAKIDANVVATPVVVAGKLIVIDVTGRMYSINRLDGKIEYSLPLGGAVTGSPIAVGDRLAVPVGGDIKMFDISNNYNQLWQFGVGTPVTTSLACNTIKTSDTLNIFFVSDTSVYAIRVDSGLLTWKRGIPGAGKFNSSICAANNNYLYAGNDNGKLYAFDIRNGNVFWSYQTEASVRSSPISKGGNIMVGSDDRYFYSVDSATGQLRWKTAAQDRILSSAFVYDQDVYFGSNDFNFYTVNIIDGTLKRKQQTFGTITTSPLAHNGVVYFNSHDNTVYAIDAKTGEQKWTYNAGGYMTSSMILDMLDETIVPSISGNSPL